MPETVLDIPYTLRWPDWIVLIGYAIGIAALGLYFAKRQKTSEHYFTASGRIPGWAAGLSLFATLLSSFLFIGFPGQTYERNWEVLMQQFMTPFVVIFVAILIVPVLRRHIKVSVYEYLEERFGYGARVYGTLAFLAEHFFKMGVVLTAMSLAIYTITGWNQDTVILCLGIITIAYTFFGGIEGVIWTDVVQGLLMLASSFFVIGYILFFASHDGAGAILHAAIEDDKFKLIDPEFDMQRKTVYVIVWMGIFHFMLRYVTDQTMVQRYLTAPSVREAQKSALVSIGACMIAWIAFSLIGTLLYGFYKLNPARMGTHVDKADQVFPWFIGHEIPAGFTGVILVGLLAASMSTLSSEFNSFSACLTTDFYERLKGTLSPRRKLMVSKGIVLACGVNAVVLAMLLSRYTGGIMLLVLNAWAGIGAVLGGGILATFFLGIFCPRTNKYGLYPALAIGFTLTLWCYATSHDWIVLPEKWAVLKYTWHPWWLIGFSNILVFALGYGLSRIFADRAKQAAIPD
jgi:SSS family solute:Na+ symporter